MQEDFFVKLGKLLDDPNPKAKLIGFLEDNLNIPSSAESGGTGAGAPLFAMMIFNEEGSDYLVTTDDRAVKVVGRGPIFTQNGGSPTLEYSHNGGSLATFGTTVDCDLDGDTDKFRVKLSDVDGLDLPVFFAIKLEAL